LSSCRTALDIFSADIALIGNGSSSSDTQHEFVSSLRRSYPKLAIILLLDSYDRSLVVNALRAGVRGLFCPASQPLKALCKCMCAVHSGKFWANPEQMGCVIEALVQSPVLAVTNLRGDVLLPKRESQVVNLVAEGLGNRAIAKELKITEKHG